MGSVPEINLIRMDIDPFRAQAAPADRDEVAPERGSIARQSDLSQQSNAAIGQ